MARSTQPDKLDTLGKRLRAWRLRRGLTQTQLGKELERISGKALKKSSISDIERGDSKSTLSVVQLAQVLRINPDYLATGEGDPERLTSMDEEALLAPAIPSIDPWPFRIITRAEYDTLSTFERSHVEASIGEALTYIRRKRAEAEAERQQREAPPMARIRL